MEETGILLEAALVAALETVKGLKNRVCPVIDIRENAGPLAVYDPHSERQSRDICGSCGLLEAQITVHALHNSYMQMRLLAEHVKRAVQAMEGLKKTPLLVEAVEVEQSTPDIFEDKVGLFRRTYNVKFYYQIKED